MNDKIKNIIKTNRQEWDDQSPETGHFDRFSARLDLRAHNLRLNRIKRIRFVAAAAVIIGLIFLFRYEKPVAEAEPTEISEVTNYYQQQWSDKRKVLQSYLYLVDKNTRTEVLTDLKSMEKDSEKLTKAKKEMPAEEYISYIVLHYNTQLERLEELTGIFQQQKQNKKNAIQS